MRAFRRVTGKVRPAGVVEYHVCGSDPGPQIFGGTVEENGVREVIVHLDEDPIAADDLLVEGQPLLGIGDQRDQVPAE